MRGQEDVDLEVVVVDDARAQPVTTSSPLVGACVRRLRSRAPGANAARNVGVEAARGRWVAFCDDDDLWAPRKLARQLQAVESSGRAWAYSGAVEVDRRATVLRGEPPVGAGDVAACLATVNCIPGGTSNVVVRRDLLLAVGCMPVELRHLADWDLSLRLSAQGPPAVVRRPDVARRLHDANESLFDGDLRPEVLWLAARHGGTPGGLAPDWAALHRHVGGGRRRLGDRRGAARAYLRAARAGDVGALALLTALVLPDGAHRHLRRMRCDRAWLAEADGWLAAQRRVWSAVTDGMQHDPAGRGRHRLAPKATSTRRPSR